MRFEVSILSQIVEQGFYCQKYMQSARLELQGARWDRRGHPFPPAKSFAPPIFWVSVGIIIDKD